MRNWKLFRARCSQLSYHNPSEVRLWWSPKKTIRALMDRSQWNESLHLISNFLNYLPFRTCIIYRLSYLSLYLPNIMQLKGSYSCKPPPPRKYTFNHNPIFNFTIKLEGHLLSPKQVYHTFHGTGCLLLTLSLRWYNIKGSMTSCCCLPLEKTSSREMPSLYVEFRHTCLWFIV